MVRKEKIVGETHINNKEAKSLKAFQKNMKKADSVRKDFEGKFIAVFDQKVVGHSTDYKSLLSEASEYIK